MHDDMHYRTPVEHHQPVVRSHYGNWSKGRCTTSKGVHPLTSGHANHFSPSSDNKKHRLMLQQEKLLQGATLSQNQDAAPVAHPTTKALARSVVSMRLPWTSKGAWHKHGMDIDDKIFQASGAANGNSFALRSPGVKLMANSEHERSSQVRLDCEYQQQRTKHCFRRPNEAGIYEEVQPPRVYPPLIQWTLLFLFSCLAVTTDMD